MSKPTELDANQLLDPAMAVHYKAAAYHLASHQELTPDQAKQMAERAHIGCSGDCAEQGDCNCSHSIRWMAPRQPRRPAPRKPHLPHLPLWTRLTMRWQALRAGWRIRGSWKWADCQSHHDGWCCHSYSGPHADEFLGCQAEHQNDWVASRFWRRWVANIRGWNS